MIGASVARCFDDRHQAPVSTKPAASRRKTLAVSERRLAGPARSASPRRADKRRSPSPSSTARLSPRAGIRPTFSPTTVTSPPTLFCGPNHDQGSHRGELHRRLRARASAQHRARHDRIVPRRRKSPGRWRATTLLPPLQTLDLGATTSKRREIVSPRSDARTGCRCTCSSRVER